MLTRIAESYYWAGRYVERSEHLARFLRVQYFAALDAPRSLKRKFVLNSILAMYDIDLAQGDRMEDADVLSRVATEEEEPNSLLATLRQARENASSLRSVIPNELWESINSLYVYGRDYNREFFASHGLHEYTSEIGRHCAVIRSRIDDTLLHGEGWALMKVGIHLERTIQVLRIILIKLRDIAELRTEGAGAPVLTYQGTILLNVLEAHDIHLRHYGKGLTPATTVQFLIGHLLFARSAAYNMQVVTRLLKEMEGLNPKRNLAIFQAGKLFSYFRFLEYAEVEDDLESALSAALRRVLTLNQTIRETYLN